MVGYLKKLDERIVHYLLPLGLIIQLTGVIWIGRGAGWIAQTYTWLMLPAFVSLLLNLRYIKSFRPCSGLVFILVFLLWATITKVWSDTPLSYLAVTKNLLYICLYLYALVRLSERPEKLIRIIVFCCIIGIFAALVSLVYQYGVLGHPTGYRQYRISSFVPGSFADLGYPIMAGLYYGIFFSGLLSSLYFKDRLSIQYVLLIWAGLLVMGLYVFMTGSRGPWVALVCSTIFTFIVTPNKRSLIISAVMVIICATFIYVYFHVFKNQVLDDTYSGRTEIWKTALHKIANRPWLGYGIDSDFTAYNDFGVIVHHPHSYYLQVLRSYGIVGGVLFLLTLIWMGLFIFKQRRVKLVKLAGAILVFSCVGMLTDVRALITRPSIAWFYIWLPLGILIGCYYQLKRSCTIEAR